MTCCDPYENDEHGRWSECIRHIYRPHPKYPWFCVECGYPEHEDLKHNQPKEGK